MIVTPIPCLSDNYAYLVVCETSGLRAIVDVSEAGPVAKALDKGALAAIWSTHHHFDHVGGNEEIARRFDVKDVYGHVSDRGRIPGQTKFLDTGATFAMGSLTIRAMHVPGHTTGAVSYVVHDASVSSQIKDAVFTGDTMFLSGCGRLFEGTPAQMHASLAALAALDPETRVFCGHEYTEANLRFAHHVEPGNAAIAARQAHAKELRAAGKPTVPGTIADERTTNPFVRTSSSEIRAKLRIPLDADDATALGAIRRAKDDFKG